MGYGTGVLRAHYVVAFMRGLTPGVVSTSSLFISAKTGTPQHWVMGARGIGMIVAPLLASDAIGRATWHGNMQVGYAVLLLLRAICEVSAARVSSTFVLLPIFVLIGGIGSCLDTWRTILAGIVHREKLGQAMVIYSGIYGLGCTVAPYLTVCMGMRAWDALACIDTVTATLLLRKFLIIGRPRNWKEKIRSGSDGSLPGSSCTSANNSVAGSLQGSPANVRPVPRSVLRAGVAFIFIVEATETAMSSWCFTYAVTHLKFSPHMAAVLPTAFYTTFTGMRLLVIPLSRKLAPSALVQFGAWAVLVCGVAFFVLTRLIDRELAQGMPSTEVGSKYLTPLLTCLSLYGIGSCPLYSMMLASIRRHGTIMPRQAGIYDTACNLGITCGLAGPSMLILPRYELLGVSCLWLITVTHTRYFPWKESELPF